jgi:hypothetical protein
MLGTGEHVVAAVEKPAWQVGQQTRQQWRRSCGRGVGVAAGRGVATGRVAASTRARQARARRRGWVMAGLAGGEEDGKDAVAPANFES